MESKVAPYLVDAAVCSLATLIYTRCQMSVGYTTALYNTTKSHILLCKLDMPNTWLANLTELQSCFNSVVEVPDHKRVLPGKHSYEFIVKCCIEDTSSTDEPTASDPFVFFYSRYGYGSKSLARCVCLQP